MGYAEDLHRLQRFFTRSIQMMSLGGVTFYINPVSWSEETETVHVEVITAGGVGRFDFGTRPTSYQLYGTTGVGGIDELMRMKTLMVRGRTRNAPVPFTYPNVFTGVRMVYIDKMRKEQSPENGHLYIFFTMTLTEIIGTSTPAVPLPDAAALAVALPPGG